MHLARTSKHKLLSNPALFPSSSDILGAATTIFENRHVLPPLPPCSFGDGDDLLGPVFSLSSLSSSPYDGPQCIWALGNIAGDGPAARDMLLGLGILQPLLWSVPSGATMAGLYDMRKTTAPWFPHPDGESRVACPPSSCSPLSLLLGCLQGVEQGGQAVHAAQRHVDALQPLPWEEPPASFRHGPSYRLRLGPVVVDHVIHTHGRGDGDV